MLIFVATIAGGGSDILGEVDAALGAWRREAKEVGLEAAWVRKIERLFRRFA